MKIVGPTIVEPWREQIEGARHASSGCTSCCDRMHHFTVLDPACGSGNFLYIAYRELKRLEARIYERIGETLGQGRPGAAGVRLRHRLATSSAWTSTRSPSSWPR